MTSIRSTGHILRALLLAVSLLAAATAVVYQWYPSLLQRLDRILINAHLASHEDRLERARRALNVDRSEAIAILQGLLSDLKRVRHMDRLKRVKRQAYVWVVDALMAEGNPGKALYWADQWTAYDGRDLQGQAAKARIWYQMDATRQEGLRLTRALYRMAPEAEFIAKTYVEAAIDQNDGLGALQAVLKQAEAYRTAPVIGWEVYFNTGRGFNRRNMRSVMPVIIEGGAMSLIFKTLPGTRMIRLDPPPGQELMLIGAQITYTACGRVAGKPLLDTPLKLHQMTLTHDALFTTGGDDPFFYWPLTGELRTQRVVVEVIARVNRPYPPWLGTLGGMASEMLADTRNPGAEALRSQALFADFELDLARQSGTIERLAVDHRKNQIKMLGSLAGGRMKIYWKKGAGGFTESQTSIALLNARLQGEKIVFDTSLAVGSKLNQIRLDFPDIRGAVFRIEDAIISGPGANAAVSFKKTDTSHANSMEVLEEAFRVTGKDPHVTLFLGGDNVQVSSLRLKGVIR